MTPKSHRFTGFLRKEFVNFEIELKQYITAFDTSFIQFPNTFMASVLFYY